MKKLIISCTFVLLSGCSLWMAGFDNNEYGLVNKIRTISSLKQCDEYSVRVIYANSLELKNYSQYIPRNKISIGLDITLLIPFLIGEAIKE